MSTDNRELEDGAAAPPANGAAAPPALEEQAYRRLRQSLVEGVFAPGDKLSIRRVAAGLGTSPMPVRSALRRLAAEQALDVLPSGTAVVPRLGRDAFAELGAIRAELEPLAVRLAAPRLDAAALDALEALVVDGRAARQAGVPERFLDADRRFLFGLYRAAAAPMLLALIEALWLRRGPLFWEARWVLMSRPMAGDRHPEILAALRAGRGEDAAAELRREIADATAFLLDNLRFEVVAPGDGVAALRALDRRPPRPGG